MAKKGIHLINKNEKGEPQQSQGMKDESKKPEGEGGKKPESARKKVKNAQLKVLQNLDDIVTGNCTSAIGGNSNCAKFMLDWSGVSDLRAPLAKPLKQRSIARVLLKKLKQVAESQPKPGTSEDGK